MESNSLDDVPDSIPPCLPKSLPPLIHRSHSPVPVSFPQKPPRVFFETSSNLLRPPSPDLSLDSSTLSIDVYLTPPDSLIVSASNETEKPRSDPSKKTSASSENISSESSENLSFPTVELNSPTLPTVTCETSTEDSKKSTTTKEAVDSTQKASTEESGNPCAEVREEKAAVIPTVLVEPPTNDASPPEEVFLDSEDHHPARLRSPSLRGWGSSGSKAYEDSVRAGRTLKRAMSTKIDSIGSAISRFLDREKSPGSDRERPKSIGLYENDSVRRYGGRQNGTANDMDKLILQSSNFLRRSFRQIPDENQGDDPSASAPLEATETGSTVSVWTSATTAGRRSYNEDLVATLVCAACARYMVGPIEQCKRGHNVCKSCRRFAHNHRCPAQSCGARFSGIRNIVAENMARMLLFPCVHAHAGCRRQVPCDDLEFHEPRCPFRIYSCLIHVSSGSPCSWKGRRMQLEEHVKNQHPRYYSPQEVTKWRWCPNLLVKMEDFQLLSAFGELFWYCAAQDPQRLRVCWFVQHVGYDEDSENFEFRFEFAADEKDRMLEFACRTLPDYSSVSSIIESGHCLDMSYQQALSFVDEEGTIKFSVTLEKLE